MDEVADLDVVPGRLLQGDTFLVIAQLGSDAGVAGLLVDGRGQVAQIVLKHGGRDTDGGGVRPLQVQTHAAIRGQGAQGGRGLGRGGYTRLLGLRVDCLRDLGGAITCRHLDHLRTFLADNGQVLCFDIVGCACRSGSGGHLDALCGSGIVGGQRVVAEIGGPGRADAEGDGLAGIGAHLELGGDHRAVQQFFAVERGGLGDPGQFLLELVHFGLQGGAVRGAVGIVGRLHGQLTHALQDVGGLLHRAFRGLGQRDAVVGVTGGLVEAADLGGHPVGNGQTGRIVLGRVDPKTT